MSFARGLGAGLQLGDAVQERRYTRAVSKYEQGLADQEAAANRPQPRDNAGRQAAEGLGAGGYGPPTPGMDAAAGYTGPTGDFTPPSDLERMQHVRGLAARFNRGSELQRYDEKILGETARQEQMTMLQDNEQRRRVESDRSFGHVVDSFNKTHGLAETREGREQQAQAFNQSAVERQQVLEDASRLGTAAVDQGILNGNLSESLNDIYAIEDPNARNAAMHAFTATLTANTGITSTQLRQMHQSANSQFEALRNTEADPATLAQLYTQSVGDYLDPDINNGQSVMFVVREEDGAIELIEGNKVHSTFRDFDEVNAAIEQTISDPLSFSVGQITQRQQRAQMLLAQQEAELAKRKMTVEEAKAAQSLISDLYKDPRFMTAARNEQEEMINARMRQAGLNIEETGGQPDPTGYNEAESAGRETPSFLQGLSSRADGRAAAAEVSAAAAQLRRDLRQYEGGTDAARAAYEAGEMDERTAAAYEKMVADDERARRAVSRTSFGLGGR